MSVFNGEDWIEYSVNSILKQSFGEFEFVIVNDGSVDSTGRIIERLARSDKRIRCVHNHTNKGLVESLNIGLSIAEGKWIARQDVDDFAFPTRLERQLKLIEKTPDVVLVGSGMELRDETKKHVKMYRFPTTHRSLVERLVRSQAFFPHSSAMFEASVARSLGGYRKFFKRAQDWDLWFRLSEVGKVKCLNESLVAISKHQNQISQSNQGLEQIVYSRAAIASYLLRRMGVADPVGDLENRSGHSFLEFIERRVRGDRIYTQFYNRFWFGSVVKLLSGILLKIHGDFKPHRYATEWELIARNADIK